MKIIRKTSLICLSAIIIFTLLGCGASSNNESEVKTVIHEESMEENNLKVTESVHVEAEKGNTEKPVKVQRKGDIELIFEENTPTGEEFEEAKLQTEAYLEEKYGKDFYLTGFETYYEYDENNVQQFKEFVGKGMTAFDEEELDFVFDIHVDKHGNVGDNYELSHPHGTIYQEIEKEIHNTFGNKVIIEGEENVTSAELEIYIPVDSQIDVSNEANKINDFNHHLIEEQDAENADLRIYYVTQDFFNAYYTEHAEGYKMMGHGHVRSDLSQGEDVDGVESFLFYNIESNQLNLTTSDITEKLTQNSNY